MQNEPVFKLELASVIVDKRLSSVEIKTAVQEVQRLTFMTAPIAHWTVEAIESTNHEWHRQKLPNERFRTILKIDLKRKIIFVKAILLREGDTYSVVVRNFYIEEDE